MTTQITRVSKLNLDKRTRLYHSRISAGETSTWARAQAMPPSNGFISTFSAIDGVVVVATSSYTIFVEIGHSFSWDEIEPKILEVPSISENVVIESCEDES